MKIYGTKTIDVLIFPPEQVAIRQQFLSNLKNGDMVCVEYSKWHPEKSHKQLGAWFGLFSKTVIQHFNDNGWDSSILLKLSKPTGVACSDGLLKEYMYSVCPVFDSNGKRVTMRDMDTAQMASFFDNCRNFASSQWSIYVPEPQKDWKKRNVLNSNSV